MTQNYESDRSGGRQSVIGAVLSLVLMAIPGLTRGSESPDGPTGGQSMVFEEALRNLVASGQIPGAVVLTSRGGETASPIVIGKQDRATAEPMTVESIFRLYSMSKPIASVAIMMLVEDGDLSLNQAVETLIPELAGMKVYQSGRMEEMVTVPARRSITIEDLLLHQSGITYHFTGTTPVHEYYRRHGVLRDTPVGRTPEDGEPAGTLDELVARIGRAPLLHQPGDEFAYSYSTTVLGAVVERVSGQRLDQFLEARIFQPLGMESTGFFVADEDLGRFVTNYMMTDSGLVEIESGETSDYRDQGRLLDGGGALAGTAGDYQRFVQMLAGGGALGDVRLLSEDGVRLMFKPHTRIGNLGPEVDFGYGFAIAGDDGTPMMPAGTVGWSGSGNTFFWLDPETGNAVVFMTQVITPEDHLDLATRLRQLTIEATVELF